MRIQWRLANNLSLDCLFLTITNSISASGVRSIKYWLIAGIINTSFEQVSRFSPEQIVILEEHQVGEICPTHILTQGIIFMWLINLFRFIFFDGWTPLYWRRLNLQGRFFFDQFCLFIHPDWGWKWGDGCTRFLEVVGGWFRIKTFFEINLYLFVHPRSVLTFRRWKRLQPRINCLTILLRCFFSSWT